MDPARGHATGGFPCCRACPIEIGSVARSVPRPPFRLWPGTDHRGRAGLQPVVGQAVTAGVSGTRSDRGIHGQTTIDGETTVVCDVQPQSDRSSNPKQFESSAGFRAVSRSAPIEPDPHRCVLSHASHTTCRSSSLECGTHNEGSGSRVAATAPACEWGEPVPSCGSSPYVPWFASRESYESQGIGSGHRSGDFVNHDCHRTHGTRSTTGSNELLGGDRHHEPSRGHPSYRRHHRHPALGRPRRRQCNTQSPLQPPSPITPRVSWREHTPYGRATSIRAEQSIGDPSTRG